MPKIPDDYPVSARSLSNIEAEMDRLRSLAGYLPGDRIEPDEFMSALHIQLRVRSIGKMQGAISYAVAQENTIYVTQEMSKGLRLLEPKHLYMWGHEVSHLALHRGSGPKARLAGVGNRSLNFIAKDTSAEHQAWQGARALFLPRIIITSDKDPKDLAALSGVPEHAVRLRIDEVVEAEKQLQSKKLPPRSNSIQSKQIHSINENADYVQHARLRCWEKAGTISDEDPGAFRLARGFKIRWEDYRILGSQYGWCEWAGEARAYMDLFSR